MMDHTDFGTTLVEEILPYHLEYYLGVKKDYGREMGGEDGDDDDSSKGSESSGSEKAGKKGKKAAKGPAAAGAPKQDCK